MDFTRLTCNDCLLQVQGVSIKQSFKQTSAQADRRTSRQMHWQTARTRSSSVKWRTASGQPQKGKWNKKHGPAWYIGKDSKLKMSNNMADEAAAIHVQKQCA